MNYGYVVDGQILRLGLPQNWKTEDGGDIIGFNLLSVEELKAHGWLPIEQGEMPEYDQATQYTQHTGYDVQEDKIAYVYTVMTYPVAEPNLEQLLTPSQEEVSKAEREIETINLLIELGVIV